ncbi:MAG: hypothetical protein GX146_07410 [Myxococcales bacterium]|nr:hypothetical protein [Myxococcales bacterium]
MSTQDSPTSEQGNGTPPQIDLPLASPTQGASQQSLLAQDSPTSEQFLVSALLQIDAPLSSRAQIPWQQSSVLQDAP